MSRRTYVRLRSWHIANGLRTLCGRVAGLDRPVSSELPLDDRSCESCLRLAAADSAAVVLASASAERDA